MLVGAGQDISHVKFEALSDPAASQARDAIEGVKPAAHFAVHAELSEIVMPSVNAPEAWTLAMPVGAGQFAPHVNAVARVPSAAQARVATEGVKPTAHWALHKAPRAIVEASAPCVHAPLA